MLDLVFDVEVDLLMEDCDQDATGRLLVCRVPRGEILKIS